MRCGPRRPVSLACDRSRSRKGLPSSLEPENHIFQFEQKHSVVVLASRDVGWHFLRSTLQRRQSWRIVADVFDLPTAEQAVRQYQPDFIFLGANANRLPVEELIDALHTRSLTSKIVIFGDEKPNKDYSAKQRPGVAGYFLWQGLSDELLDPSLAAIAAGSCVYSPDVMVPAETGETVRPHQRPTSPPTERERRVLIDIRQGKRQQEIAREQHLSLRSVEGIVCALKAKYRVRTVGELVDTTRELDLEG